MLDKIKNGLFTATLVAGSICAFSFTASAQQGDAPKNKKNKKDTWPVVYNEQKINPQLHEKLKRNASFRDYNYIYFLVDLNGDNIKDAIVREPGGTNGGNIEIFRGLPDGNFTPESSISCVPTLFITKSTKGSWAHLYTNDFFPRRLDDESYRPCRPFVKLVGLKGNYPSNASVVDKYKDLEDIKRHEKKPADIIAQLKMRNPGPNGWIVIKRL